jgi:hypothetical protein
MRYETVMKYVAALADAARIKEDSDLCNECRSLGKCGCAENEICQVALAKHLGVKEPAVNNFTNKAKGLGLLSVRMINTRKRPYRFIGLAKKALIPLF